MGNTGMQRCKRNATQSSMSEMSTFIEEKNYIDECVLM